MASIKQSWSVLRHHDGDDVSERIGHLHAYPLGFDAVGHAPRARFAVLAAV